MKSKKSQEKLMYSKNIKSKKKKIMYSKNIIPKGEKYKRFEGNFAI